MHPSPFRFRSSLLTAVLGIFLQVGAVAAEESWGYDIAHELMSPYCPGRTLASCPSPQAAELVQWIVMQESAGASREQVIEMLVERFGEDIRGAPKAEGMTLWAYIMPVLGFVVAGGVAFLVLRKIVSGGGMPGGQPAVAGLARSSGPTLDGSPSPVAGDDEDLARIVDGDLDFRA